MLTNYGKEKHRRNKTISFFLKNRGNEKGRVREREIGEERDVH